MADTDLTNAAKTSQPQSKKKLWKRRHTLLLTVIIVLISILALRPSMLPSGEQPDLIANWLLSMILLVFACVVIGHGIKGKFSGILITETNRYSLSRVQLALWTIIVLSAFLIKYQSNIAIKVADPLGVGVPEELLAIMGISTASLVGSPLIRDAKKKSQTVPSAPQQTALANAGKVSEGVVAHNASIDGAAASDIFMGDEVGDFDTVDIGKLQMFFFTLFVVAAYIAQLDYAFLHPNARDATKALITYLPDLTPGMVALLGISHAGYLANKAAPHT